MSTIERSVEAEAPPFTDRQPHDTHLRERHDPALPLPVVADGFVPGASRNRLRDALGAPGRAGDE